MIAASLFFVASSSLVALMGCLLMGSLNVSISTVALVLGFAASLWVYKNQPRFFKARPVSMPVGVFYALILLGIYFQSVFLFFKRGDSYIIQNPFNLGDLSFHWGVIRYIAKGAHFWPENPIYLDFRFKYPFGMDFFNSLFENLGVAIHSHMSLVTLTALLVTFAVLHLSGGPLLVFAIFFSAGFYDFITPETWDLNRVQDTLDFKNLFLTVLLTQRGFLYALPAGVYLYSALQKQFAKEWSPNLSQKIILGVLWGALGFFHLHTFFFVSLFLGLMILWQRQLKTWVPTLVTAIVLGVPFVINALIPEAGGQSLIHFSRGWARPENVNYIYYWLKNMGPWLVVMITAAAYSYRRKDWNLAVPVVLILVLFAVFAHLILAPWDWDNIKLLMWCYVFGLLTLVGPLWDERTPLFRGVLSLIFFLPGFLIFIHAMPLFYRGTEWVSARELVKAEFVLKGQDVNAGLLASPDYQHPALLLGYKLFMGYPGHVWSHGYNYGVREAIVNRFYGENDHAVLQELPKGQVGLIYNGPMEKRREVKGWDDKGLTKIQEAADHELYRF